MFLHWAKGFVEDIAYLREGGKILYDGYSCHIQFTVLQCFKNNGVVVITIPAHTSHVLQPLDVSVYGTFKSYIQREVNNRTMVKRVLDVFDVADIFKFAMSGAVTARNVISGFMKCGIWNAESNGTSIENLQHLQFYDENCRSETFPRSADTLEELLDSFKSTCRGLLGESHIEESGTVRIDTKTGAHLIAAAVLEALRKRAERRQSRGFSRSTISEVH